MSENDAKSARPPEVSLPAFGRRITRLREGHGWSSRSLARRTSLHPERLRRLEKGAREPLLLELTRIAAELEVSLDALVFGLGLEPDAPAEPTPPAAGSRS